jgi:redox-sensitive bicupin YhaK (pirin superfamily)
MFLSRRRMLGGVAAAAGLALFGDDGSGIYFRNPTSKPARALLGGGAPIAEPLARYGPFAMNTQAELQRAVEDYREGRMGRVANPTYERILL